MGKTKLRYTYGIVDFFKDYKSQRKKAGLEPIPYKLYKNICFDFFKEIYLAMVGSNFIFRMPYNLGAMHILCSKWEKGPVDYRSSQDKGRIVRYRNAHTYKHVFKYKWQKDGVRLRNKTSYNFKPTRSQCATDEGVGKKALKNKLFSREWHEVAKIFNKDK